MARVHAAQDRAHHRVGRGGLLRVEGGALEVERDGVAQELDVAQLLGRGHHQHVAVLGVPARAHRLEEVLHGDADLALDAADGLLEMLGEDRVGLVHADLVLELGGVVEHR